MQPHVGNDDSLSLLRDEFGWSHVPALKALDMIASQKTEAVDAAVSIQTRDNKKATKAVEVIEREEDSFLPTTH